MAAVLAVNTASQGWVVWILSDLSRRLRSLEQRQMNSE
jgi:hypothetical protein